MPAEEIRKLLGSIIRPDRPAIPCGRIVARTTEHLFVCHLAAEPQSSFERFQLIQVGVDGNCCDLEDRSPGLGTSSFEIHAYQSFIRQMAFHLRLNITQTELIQSLHIRVKSIAKA